MAEVSLTIAGRQYAVHCRDGEEAHLHHLAALVEEKARQTQGTTEMRQLLYAALFLADDIDGLKGEAAGRQGQVLDLTRRAEADEAARADRIETIAGRIEALAEKLAPAPARP